MKITICSSLAFIKEIKEVSEKLKELNHDVLLPRTAERILNGELSQDKINNDKGSRAFSEQIIKNDAIRVHYNKIRESDAILVLNFDKNNTKDYIGGAVFLEIGFAHVNNKKIFLLNNIPELSYKDEIEGMQPIIINGNLNKIK
ncbi:MAG: hypothetical protein AABW58_03120 [Nanoarchaeota archaeon]